MTEVEEQFFGEYCSVGCMVAYKSSVVKMKEHLPFCGEFGILCIEDGELCIVVDHVA